MKYNLFLENHVILFYYRKYRKENNSDSIKITFLLFSSYL